MFEYVIGVFLAIYLFGVITFLFAIFNDRKYVGWFLLWAFTWPIAVPIILAHHITTRE